MTTTMSGKTRGGASIIVAAIFISAVTAEALTLREAIDRAVAENHNVKAVEASKAAASWAVDQAKSGFMPTVELSEVYTATNSPLNAFGLKLNQERIKQDDFIPSRLNDPDQIVNWRTAISLRQPLYAGGRITNEYEKASLGEDQAELGVAHARREIAANVAKTWLNLWFLEERKRILGISLKLAEDSVKLTEDRVAAGLALKPDLLDMKINRQRTKKEINEVSSNIATTLSTLKTLLGMSPDDELDLEMGSYTANLDEAELPKLVEEALSARADTQIAEAGIEQQRREIESAKSGFLSSVGLAADYEWNSEDFIGSDGDSWAVAVEAKWNIFAGGRDKSRARMARARLDALIYEKRALRDRVRVAVERDYRALQTSIENLAIARDQEKLAEESYRITRQMYDQGMKTAHDLLGAETRLERARLNTSASELDLLLARVRLDYTLGRDNVSIMEER